MYVILQNSLKISAIVRQSGQRRLLLTFGLPHLQTGLFRHFAGWDSAVWAVRVRLQFGQAATRFSNSLPPPSRRGLIWSVVAQ